MSKDDSETVSLSTSYTEMTEMLLPNDTNSLGRALGGVVLHWMDICGGIASLRFCNQPVVTASMDHVDFISPLGLSDIAVIEAYVYETGRTSMNVKVDVHAENPREGETRETTSSFLTFVAVDDSGTPVEVPELVCETENEDVLQTRAKRERREEIEALAKRIE